MNCEDRDNLVKAERAKALKLYAAQIDKLDRAIVAAQATRSPIAAATANEAAAQFYLEWGKEKIAEKSSPASAKIRTLQRFRSLHSLL